MGSCSELMSWYKRIEVLWSGTQGHSGLDFRPRDFTSPSRDMRRAPELCERSELRKAEGCAGVAGRDLNIRKASILI